MRITIKSYIAFTGKEFRENIRTYKMLIMLIVFMLIGIENPLTAKLTPLLLEKFLEEGISITLPEPSAFDSWAQFFKNVPQMGLIVMVIVFSGMMAGEYTKGTLINMLTKGLSRSTVLLSKFTMAFTVWTVSFWLCYGITYAYTIYFWGSKGVVNLLFSIFLVWLFGVLLLASLILGGVLFKSSYGCLLFTGSTVVVLFLINIIPTVQKYNPVKLVSGNMALIKGGLTTSDFTAAVVVTVILILLLVAGSVPVFNKKQL